MRKSLLSKHTIIVSALSALLPLQSFAAGYQMRYQSAETMGTAFASDVSGAKTASGFFNNPALLMNMGEGIHFSAELMGLFPTGKFENDAGPDASGFASTSFIPSLYYGQKFNDQMGLVVSFTVPWATNTEYDEGWAGATYALKTYLATYNLAPSFVYAMNDKLSLSVGPQIQFITGELSQAIAPGPGAPVFALDGDHMGVGLTAAALFKASDKLRLGFNYKSRIKHTIEGTQTVTPDPTGVGAPIPNLGADGDDAELEISTPDVITIGASYLLNERWDLHGSLSWSSWSVFDQLAIRNASGNDSPAPSPANWDDTYFVAVGTDYYYNDKWTFRGGLSYETGAPPDAFRTPRGVDNDRALLGLGAGYTVSESMVINGALTQLFYTSAPTLDLPAPGQLTVPLSGEYKGNMATAIRIGISKTF